MQHTSFHLLMIRTPQRNDNSVTPLAAEQPPCVRAAALRAA